MSKYKNKDGISLNYQGNDSHKVLVREVIEEAIRILDSHNMFDSQSKSWAIDRGINFFYFITSIVFKQKWKCSMNKNH